MKAKLEVTLRTMVTIEIPDGQKEKLEGLDYPMDVDDFEQTTGLQIDPDEMLNPDSCEVEDIFFDKTPGPAEPRHDDGEATPEAASGHDPGEEG